MASAHLHGDNPDREIFGRRTRYVVLPVDSVRTLNVRTDKEVVEAQKGLDTPTLNALEELVNAAKAGRLEGDAALRLAAVKW